MLQVAGLFAGFYGRVHLHAVIQSFSPTGLQRQQRDTLLSDTSSLSHIEQTQKEKTEIKNFLAEVK